MLESHKSMWEDQIGEIVAMKHRIELKPGSVNKNQILYRQGLEIWDAKYKQISQQLDDGVIELSTSEWDRPVVLVPKKEGSVRFCVDYRLNAATVPDMYSLPRMDDWLDSLGYAKVFTILDSNCYIGKY